MLFETSHGHASGKRKTAEYNAWHDMKQRCSNPKSDEFKNYGARGITFCDRWQEFVHFLDDMGLRPSPRHSLDRKDNNLNYSPDNCRWAPKLEQDRNRRTCRMLTHRGVTRPLIAWAEWLGMNRHALPRRLKEGISLDDIMDGTLERGLGQGRPWRLIPARMARASGRP